MTNQIVRLRLTLSQQFKLAEIIKANSKYNRCTVEDSKIAVIASQKMETKIKDTHVANTRRSLTILPFRIRQITTDQKQSLFAQLKERIDSLEKRVSEIESAITSPTKG